MTSLTHADEAGFFGNRGGRFLPSRLEASIAEVVAACVQARQDLGFQVEHEALLVDYIGRPSPLFLAAGLTRYLGGAETYLKREDLDHIGAHKINHCLGEGLLAKRMGKKKLIAGIGAGQRGVVLATVVVLLGLECEIHMGAVDVAKQHPNVVRMEALGARVVSITSGGQTPKEAISSAFSVFAADYADIFFVIGPAVGPDLYSSMVRDLQSIIGHETRCQVLEKEDCLLDAPVAAVGGGSNALGLFTAFLEDEPMKMFGAEPAGRNLEVSGQYAATITLDTLGTLYGTRTLLLQDEDGNPAEMHSIVSGLDYLRVGPQYAFLWDTGRVEYVIASNDGTTIAFQLLRRTEGTIPALESSHVPTHAIRLAPTMSPDKMIAVNLLGHGDRDVDCAAEYLAR